MTSSSLDLDIASSQVAVETAFSRFTSPPARRRKKAYGTAAVDDDNKENEEISNIMLSTAIDTNDQDVVEESSFCLFTNDELLQHEETETVNDDAADCSSDEDDDDDDDERTVDMNQPHEQEQQEDQESVQEEGEADLGIEEEDEPIRTGGRTKKSFSGDVKVPEEDLLEPEEPAQTEQDDPAETCPSAAVDTDDPHKEVNEKVEASDSDASDAVDDSAKEVEEEEAAESDSSIVNNDDSSKDVNETEEAAETAADETDDSSKEDASKEEAKEAVPRADTVETAATPTGPEQPSDEAVIALVDELFVEADKDSVTVGDIVRSIEAKLLGGANLLKPTKKMVRNRLKDLITGVAKPGGVETEEAESSEEEEVSESEEEEEAEVSDYEEEEEEEAPKKKKKKPKASKPSRQKRKAPTRRSSTRTSAKKKKPSHVRIHAEMLRKKRMEELRVRNEELQLQQTKEDQKRAELIAQKFETNTEEMRLRRLEDRLDLLQKLDQKRIQLIAPVQDKKEEVPKLEKEQPKDEANNDATSLIKPELAAVPSVESTEESDVDSEEEDDVFELEIVGGKDEKSLPLPATNTTTVGFAKTERSNNSKKSTAFSILDLADRAKPSQKKSPKKGSLESLLKNTQKPQASPGKSLSARAALRNVLLAKQRKAGNMWLARELGYKTEEDHLRDCLFEEQQKREKVLKMEEERLRANEHQRLRERLFLEGNEVEVPAEEDSQEEAATEEQAEEMDEEMAMAKEIENENLKAEQNDTVSSTPTDEAPSCPKSMTDAPPDLKEESKDPEQQPEFNGEEENVVSEAEPANLDGVGDPGQEVVPESTESNAPTNETIETGASTPKEVDTEPVPIDAACTSVTAGDVERLLSQPKLENDENTTETNEAVPPVTETSEFSEEVNAPATKPDLSDEEENEFNDDQPKEDEKEQPSDGKEKKPRNAAWQAMLQKEAEQVKSMKKRKGGLVEAEADEEEEEEVAGLEDFGFSLIKKKKDDEEDEPEADKLDDDDLENIVDDVSDDEGDEEAGDAARKELQLKEEKERHKEIMRRMREGYDGRRGGIAGTGVGARGNHRFDQLVAADNREDAKRLGLLNDDELDSDDEGEREMKDGDDNQDDDEDENALLDKMLKDRFLHRSSVELEENFSDDEDEEDDAGGDEDTGNKEDEEEKEQERLAKRFAKRARMQRLLETHGEDKEFSQLRLIDEDESMKLELKKMKNVLSRNARQTSVSSTRMSSSSDSRESDSGTKGQLNEGMSFGSFLSNSGKLSLALQASRRSKTKTSFLGGSCKSSKEAAASIHKSVALSHVVFHTGDSQLAKSSMSFSSNRRSTNTGKRKHTSLQASTSLWSKVSANGFKKRR